MAKAIMIQGTMSNAGKSLLAAGLCRIFRQDGYRVAPFKSQNMALNSFITEDGLEMGRAQVMQAEAAGIAPDVRMNPILLKPTTETGSQVIVRGEVLGDMDARKYFAYKKSLMPMVLEAYHSLAAEYDIIVIEGAGSPAEINLKKDDIVNMGLAKAVGAPVLLAGDIDRGGVFAQLLGTHMLLEPDEQALLKGFIINKFRGDKTILDPGITMLEERGGVPVVGVIPFMQLDIDDEDSLSPQLSQTNRPPAGKPVEIAVIRLPHLSNFTDFNVFSRIQEADLRYVSKPRALGDPDMVILPGTKNTMADLRWLKESGMAAAIDDLRRQGCPVFGICGGYQMLGRAISDPYRTEEGGSARGLGFLETETFFSKEKRRTRVSGRIAELPGIFKSLGGMEIEGYEIHMGRTARTAVGNPCGSPCGEIFSVIKEQRTGIESADGTACGNIYGTYIHGVFDAPGLARRIVEILADRKGVTLRTSPDYEEKARLEADIRTYKETQYDILADTMRRYLDMKKIYEILEQGEGVNRSNKNWSQGVETAALRGERMTEIEHVLPEDIEKTSFRIIEQELREQGREIPEEKKHVILRAIHTTADFEYLDTMAFSEGVLEKASNAIRRGAHIVTDTTMAMSGINKRKLAAFGGEVHCYVADPEVVRRAKEEGTTRSAAAVDKAVREAKEKGVPLIFAVGNAPTALLALEEKIHQGYMPELVIAVPVGFVNVVQAKERIMASGVPYICNRGRKGGSNVAAAICNAILYSME